MADAFAHGLHYAALYGFHSRLSLCPLASGCCPQLSHARSRSTPGHKQTGSCTINTAGCISISAGISGALLPTAKHPKIEHFCAYRMPGFLWLRALVRRNRTLCVAPPATLGASTVPHYSAYLLAVAHLTGTPLSWVTHVK